MYNIIVNSKMGFLNFMESFFFISLGITFIFILLLVYHFKERIIGLEKKSDTMFEIINNVVKELSNIKQNVFEKANNYSKIPINMFPISPFSNILSEELNTMNQQDNYDIIIKDDDCNDIDTDDETVSLGDNGDEDDDEDDGEYYEDGESDVGDMSSEDDNDDIVYNVEEVSNQTDMVVSLNTEGLNIHQINYEDIDIDVNIHEELVQDIKVTKQDNPESVSVVVPEEIKKDDTVVVPEEVVVSEEIKKDDIVVVPEEVVVSEEIKKDDAEDVEDVEDYSENKETEEQTSVNKVININDKDLYHKMTISQLKTIVVSKGLATDTSVNKYKKSELIKLLENIKKL